MKTIEGGLKAGKPHVRERTATSVKDGVQIQRSVYDVIIPTGKDRLNARMVRAAVAQYLARSKE